MTCSLQMFDENWVCIKVRDLGFDIDRAQFDYVKACLDGVSDDRVKYIQLCVPGYPELTVTSYLGGGKSLAGLNLAEPNIAGVKVLKG